MQIIAHRGASHEAPENTLAAVRLAWAQGADALEVDVHLTRDGRLAVIHDPDTRRTTGVAGRVADATLVELQRLDAGAGKGGAFAGERIPSLGEVLALVPAGKRIFVEVKGGVEAVAALQRELAEAAREHGLRPPQVVVIAFDLAGATAVKRALPDHEVCWLAEAEKEAPFPTVEEIARTARAHGLDGIDLDAAWPLDVEQVRRIRAGGCKLYVWTVDDPVLARKLVAAGVDGITTNRPGWLRANM